MTRAVPKQVRQALDGRHIPRHLLGDAPNPPSLKIAYSQHTDLNVKFQSHRSRCARALRLSRRPGVPGFQALHAALTAMHGKVVSCGN